MLTLDRPVSPIPFRFRPVPTSTPTAVPPSRHHSTGANFLLQNRFHPKLLRPKRSSASPSIVAPPEPVPMAPSTSKLSARDEPHAGLGRRAEIIADRRKGMTAMSFLALEEPSYNPIGKPEAHPPTFAYAGHGKPACMSQASIRGSLDWQPHSDSRSDSPVVAHIMPPSELSKIGRYRRSSETSELTMGSDNKSIATGEGSTVAFERYPSHLVSKGMSLPPLGTETPVGLAAIRTASLGSSRETTPVVRPTALSPPPRPRTSGVKGYAIKSPLPFIPASATHQNTVDMQEWTRSETPSPIKKSFSVMATDGSGSSSDQTLDQHNFLGLARSRLSHSPLPDKDFGVIPQKSKDSSESSGAGAERSYPTWASNASEAGSSCWSLDLAINQNIGNDQHQQSSIPRTPITPGQSVDDIGSHNGAAEATYIEESMFSQAERGPISPPRTPERVNEIVSPTGGEGGRSIDDEEGREEIEITDEERAMLAIEKRRAALRQWLSAKPRRSTDPDFHVGTPFVEAGGLAPGPRPGMGMRKVSAGI